MRAILISAYNFQSQFTIKVIFRVFARKLWNYGGTDQNLELLFTCKYLSLRYQTFKFEETNVLVSDTFYS